MADLNLKRLHRLHILSRELNTLKSKRSAATREVTANQLLVQSLTDQITTQRERIATLATQVKTDLDNI
jgi:predicted  nucleic acid-binding Zn-ribbon protein